MNDTPNDRTEGNERAGKRTIVGGRPPGRGRGQRAIPHGIEVLTKKASIDPAFRQLLLDRRAEAAREIGLELTAAEVAVLDAVPQAQLKAIIEHTRVPDPQRRAFLGKIGAVMLAAIVPSCAPPVVTGIRPDLRDTATPIEVGGIRPDLVEEPTSAPTLTPTTTITSTATLTTTPTLPSAEEDTPSD
jgi:hypothetical protein